MAMNTGRYRFFSFLLLLSPAGLGLRMTPPAASATTFYIRMDGGSSEQCTGRADTAYPGSGTGQPCAWNHPFQALPPGGTALMAGGDTLMVGPGVYQMGWGAPRTAGSCDAEAAYDCFMLPVPSGPDTLHPTRILGAGWDAGCPAPPQLWGTERANLVLNLTGSSHVRIACLEITDHSGCVEDHSDSGLACRRDTAPYGPWARVGLYAEDSADVSLADLNIHGLASRGVLAGRLTDWTVDRVRVAGNGAAGWDSDLVGDGSASANQGTLTFRRWLVEWNGCGETYPGGQPTGCWGQSAGGYGDGVGIGGLTAGHWVIEDSAILHNTSDGLDMLYVRMPGSQIEIRRTRVEGNAGNQVKTTGPVQIENSILVGNCRYFQGKPFTYAWNDDCRAAGDALVLVLRPGDQATVAHSTITGEGTCLVISGCALNQACNGSESVRLRNSIFQGRSPAPAEQTCFAWYNDESGDTLPSNPFQTEYSLINGARFGNVTPNCSGSGNLCDTAPGLANIAIDAFNARLLPSSPAIDKASSGFSLADDFDRLARPYGTAPDMGAYEFRPLSSRNFLPLIRR